MAEAVNIPRAMSMRTDSPVYRDDAQIIGRSIEVLVDGAVIPRVLGYHCDEGWVHSFRVNEQGRVCISGNRLEEIVTAGAVAVRTRGEGG